MPDNNEPTQYVVTQRNGSIFLLEESRLFSIIDFLDCIDPWEVDDWDKIYTFREGKFQEVAFRGAWHNLSDPLAIVLVVDGEVIATGRGTDH